VGATAGSTSMTSFRYVEPAEATAVVEEGVQSRITPAVRGLDLSDEDRVVAGRVRVNERALELRETVLEDRKPKRAWAVPGTFELQRGVALRREPSGDRLVIGSQEVDRESAVRVEMGIALRGVRDADEHQRRIQRDRSDRAGGEAGGPPVGVQRGDDGHAAGEVTEHTTEIVRTQHSPFVAVRLLFFKF